MPRCSETIGAIAGALAKAQAEITNPEKSMVATIRASDPRGSDQIFRYATLSSGLEIVRKSLGIHEIATVQTTAIDKRAGLIRLTTTLAHSSGEWLSTEWPVCALSETAEPRRMGAALTYARRYALFTLVGIAGEDDLDAPDLGPVTKADAAQTRSAEEPIAVGPATSIADRASATGKSKRKFVRAAAAVLRAEQSADLRDRLEEELTSLRTPDEAADWVHVRLPDKNTLTTEDAQQVEFAFLAKLAALEEAQDAGTADEAVERSPNSVVFADPEVAEVPAEVVRIAAGAPITIRERGMGTKGADIFPKAPEATSDRRYPVEKTIRLRDKTHCKFVARQPCLVCGRTPAEAHHLRFAQPRALSRKVSDEYTVPVCRTHHSELHRYGDEISWWAGVHVDPVPIALDLWRRSRPDEMRAQVRNAFTSKFTETKEVTPELRPSTL